jgi:hypothetical protein
MHKAPLLVVAGILSAAALFARPSNGQDLAAFELDRSVVNVNTLGDVKLIRTADTPKQVKIIKTREYQTSTCTEFSQHQYTGTCYTSTLIPNPRVCGLYENYTTYGPFGAIYVQRRCVYWVGGGVSTIAQPYACPATREVCTKSELEMRVGTIEFDFHFKKMHRLGDGEVEEYLLTEQNSAGRSSWDFRILDSNGRTYQITRDGTDFELKRD